MYDSIGDISDIGDTKRTKICDKEDEVEREWKQKAGETGKKAERKLEKTSMCINEERKE